jgi:hypothetical protein
MTQRSEMATLQWIVAAVTAILVVLVAFLQWRTAQQKAVLDLFDRRYAVYQVVRNAVSTMTSNPNAFDHDREIEFMDAIEHAYFFFGDDVCRYLEQLRSAIDDGRDASKEMKWMTDTAARGVAIEKGRASMDRVSKFHSEGKPLFARYMRFAQKLPARRGA